MRKANVLQIILEAIVILGSSVVGGTILLYKILDYPITRTLLGLIILCIGTIGLTEFVTLRLEFKLKSVQNFAIYIIGIILGIIIVAVKIESRPLCIIWACYNIAFAIVRILSSVFTILKQPLLAAVRVLTNLVGIVFSIILICKTIDFIQTYFLFTGIILLIESSILTIEFIIHRNQNL
jgi:hypothetical protein